MNSSTFQGSRLVFLAATVVSFSVCFAAAALTREVSSGKRQVQSAELSSLLRLFMLPTNSFSSAIPWETGSKGELPITWKHAGLKDCDEDIMRWSTSSLCRAGEVVLTLQGKVTHTVLGFRLEPGRWTVTIVGDKGGGRYVLIDSTVHSGELEYSVLRSIDRQLSFKQIEKCGEAGGSALYRVAAAGKKPMFILENATCGTAGCAINLTLGSSEDDMRGQMQSSCN